MSNFDRLDMYENIWSGLLQPAFQYVTMGFDTAESVGLSIGEDPELLMQAYVQVSEMKETLRGYLDIIQNQMRSCLTQFHNVPLSYYSCIRGVEYLRHYRHELDATFGS